MKVLVTGGAGYIGSHTVGRLLASGFEVVVYDNLTTGFKVAVPEGVELVVGDIRDQALLTQVMKDHKVGAVIHFAAMLNVAESLTIPLDYYDNNTAGVLSLARACVAAGISKVVFSSTAAVYGDVEGDGLLTEDIPKAPINPYGHSKLMSEQILQDFEKAYGLKSIRLRYFNVAGAADNGLNGQRTKKAFHLIHLASQTAAGIRSEMKIFGTDYPTQDGTCIRDYIHVEDLADVHVLALKHLLSGGTSDVFNCGYGEGFSIFQVLSTVKKVSGVNFPVEEVGRRAGDPAKLVADSTKLQSKLGWVPKRNDIDLICKSSCEWEQKIMIREL
jgi:UDP-glucose 4-epimerase